MELNQAAAATAPGSSWMTFSAATQLALPACAFIVLVASAPFKAASVASFTSPSESVDIQDSPASKTSKAGCKASIIVLSPGEAPPYNMTASRPLRSDLTQSTASTLSLSWKAEAALVNNME